MARFNTTVLLIVGIGLVVILAHNTPTVNADDPTYCLEYSERSYDCNCHACNCEVCHTCTCETKIYFWQHCTHDSCGDHGCWCSPSCRCCYVSDCRTDCNCETCCDTCTETACSRHVTYSVHDVTPTFVQAAAPTAVTISGGYFVDTAQILCKFGERTVSATFVANTAVQCTPPVHSVPAGEALSATVSVSLDNGAHWTDNAVHLSFVNCTNDCSGHGSCDERSHCVCEGQYTGADCSRLCPVDGSGDMCSGHGACTQGGGCQCDSGYWGTTCSGDCPQGPSGEVCSGSDRGLCSPETGLCVCHEGYTGTSCQHTGTCEQHGTDCTCTEKGYWGTGCENTCPGSTGCVEGSGCATTCSNHGLCTDTGECVCDPGYYGTDCGTPCPSSTADPCSGHSVTGTCDRMGHCVCASGWTGSDCGTECPGGVANPCNGQGTCTMAGFCVCNTGYVGNECETACPGTSGGTTCSGHGACTAAGTCTCAVGYFGSGCASECPGGAASPCNGHGNCNAAGTCVCEFGYYGTECDSECPGGAATPCSNHGSCDPDTGVCSCNVGFWGTECSNACPHANGGVCSGHGACGTDGQCKCNAPYTGSDCSTVYCPYDCYDHGSCDSEGKCHCQGSWTGIYCSQQVGVDPLTGAHANFLFQNGYVRTREDAGTIYLNVTRGGSTYGEVYVFYQTADVSAHAYDDYMPTSGKLEWTQGDASPRQITIDVIGDDKPEGVETFIVYLFSPSPGSTVGGNATVSISANGDVGAASDSVTVTLKISKPEEDLRLSTVQGAQFADDFIQDVCGPNVLHISTDRMVIQGVRSSGADESFMSFVLLGDAAGPATDDLAQIIWEQMHDASSPLYSGTASRYIDMDFQPVFQFSKVSNGDSPTTYWWLLGVLIPLVLFGVCGVACYKKRHQLTEWLLWRLGNFRFNSLMRHRNLDLDEDAGVGAGASTGAGAGGKPGDDIDDTRL